MARGQGWEPGEEAETDLEQGAETGGLGREERRDGLTSEPRDRRQGGRGPRYVTTQIQRAMHSHHQQPSFMKLFPNTEPQ